jgi:hypothetical protein
MKITGSILRILVVVASLWAARPAHAAAVQTHGSEQFGVLWLGVHPLGGSAFFTNNEPSIYKFGFDALGRIAQPGGLTLWLGGELNIGGISNYVLVEPGIVFQMTFERLIKIPLVPSVKIGVSGGIDNFYGSSGTCYNPAVGLFQCGPGYSYTAGDFWAKFGGGLHYFIIRQIGLGFDTNFGLGAQFYKSGGNNFSAFRGYFDFLAGAVFTF